MDHLPRSQTVKIPLTRGKFAFIDASDLAKVSGYKWYAEQTKRGSWYAATTIDRRIIRMHQLILPEATERDHVDGDGLNNRRNNLRSVTHAQNMHNSRKMRKSKLSSRFKGVTFQPRLSTRPWQSRIGELHLGYFASEEEAGAAYDRAAEQQRGEYARINGLTVTIRPNHRYRVVSKVFKASPTPGHPEARILVYVLACGHTHSISACKAAKIGNESHCVTCMEARK